MNFRRIVTVLFVLSMGIFHSTITEAVTLNASPTVLGKATIRTFDSGNFVQYPSSIAIGSDGFPIMSYYVNASLEIVKCNDKTCLSSTIQMVDPGSSFGRGQYSSIAIGRDGFPVISYVNYNNNSIMFAKCGNISCSSTTTQTIQAGSVGSLDQTAIAIGSDGFPVLSYYDGIGHHLKFAKCNDAACTSTTIRTVDSNASTGKYTAIAVGSDGFPVMSYYDEANQDLKFAKCNDLSCSAPTLQVIDTTGDVGQYTSIAIGRDGFPVISYYDVTNTHLKFAKCTDLTCSTPTLRILDTTGSNGDYSSIKIGTNGFPLISYKGANGLMLIICSDASCASTVSRSIASSSSTGTSLAIGRDGYPVISFGGGFGFRFAYFGAVVTQKSVAGKGNMPTAVTADASANVGRTSSVAVGGDGLPIMSYYDETNYDLKFIKCNDQKCVSKTTRTLDSSGTVGRESSLGVGSDGFPIISYYYQDGSRLRFLKCSDLSCSSTTIRDIETSGWTGWYTSIGVGSDGYPVISYQDVGSGYLKFAKCNDLSCASTTIRTLDSTTDARYSSITIGSDHYPIVAYEDYNAGSLNVVKCSDMSCSSSQIRRLDPGTGWTGEYASIAIGRDGNPAIAYYDHYGKKLKFLKCGNRACTATTTRDVDTTGGDTGRYSSLAIGSDGYPVIGYEDYNNGYLKLAKCNDVSCGTVTKLVLDSSTAWMGEYTSMKIGIDGFPIISYKDSVNNILKFFHCNAYCGSVTTIGKTQTKVIPSGLVGYWSFNGPQTHWATGITDDSSGQGNNAQMIGMSTSTSPVAGRIGQGLLFNGVIGSNASRVSAPVTALYDNLGPLTLSSWVKIPSGSGGGVVIGKTLAGVYRWYLTANGSGDGNFRVRCSLGDVYQAFTPTTALGDNTWHHLVVVWDGLLNTDGLLAYIDGVEVATPGSDSCATRSDDSGGVVEIGYYGAGNQSFGGKLDEVRIYNRALSAAEVKQLYNAGK